MPITEPTPEKGNLDEMTRLTLRVIQLETDLTRVKKTLEKENEFIETFAEVTKEWQALVGRITILEEARQKQRELNTAYSEALKPIEKPIKRFKWF